jgi:hypothetical protein
MKKKTPIAELLGSMDGTVIPGGCDQCNATQHMKTMANGVFMCEVRHDDNCPVLLRGRS